jgi:hypothetical protein
MEDEAMANALEIRLDDTTNFGIVDATDADKVAYEEAVVNAIGARYPEAKVTAQCLQIARQRVCATTRNEDGVILTDKETQRAEEEIEETVLSIARDVWDRGEFWPEHDDDGDIEDDEEEEEEEEEDEEEEEAAGGKTYTIREEGYDFATFEADSAEEALDLAEAGNQGDYDTSNGTVWVSWYAIDEDGEVAAERTIQIDPPEPECSGGKHDWQSPIEIVGGIKENPGVQGHGGGVIIHEVCLHCGCERVTDTWAQNPETGEQGLRSVAYEEGKYADKVADLANETV